MFKRGKWGNEAEKVSEDGVRRWRGIDTRRADLPLSCELEIWMYEYAPPEKKICVFSVASNFSAAKLAFIPRTMGNIVLVKEDQ